MSDGAASERRALWLAGAADAVVTAFGAWTVVSTLTTVAGGSAEAGLGVGSLLLLVLGALAFVPVIRARWLPAWRADVLATDALAPFAASLRMRASMALGSVGAVALWLLTRSPLLAWASVLLLSAAFAVSGLVVGRTSPAATPAPTPPPPISAWQLRAVLALMLGCAVLTLLCVRPRTDDPFYVNMSVGIADHPERPLLARATMHGPATDSLPEQSMFVPYRVHSFEALGGYLSYLTGIEAIAVVHFGLATFFGGFAVLALVRLFRVASPRYWLLALLVTLAYLWIEGSAGRGYANQGFVRMFHGKAVMLTAFVPLILAYAVRLGQRPSWPRFALLALAQISAMGLTSSALWLAPLLAMLAVVGAVPELRRVPSAALLSMLSSAYVLAMGLWVRAQMRPDLRQAVAAVAEERPERSFIELAFGRIGFAMGQALGGERASITLLLAVGLACALAERAAVGRVLAALGLLVAGGLANPWLIDLVSSSITGSLTYERVLWALPVPAAFGLCAAGACALLSERMAVAKAAGLAALGACALLALATERFVLGDDNGAALRFPPTLKTSERLRKVGAAACRLAPPGTTVLASEPVSRQLAMQHRCSPPLIAGMRWMSAPLAEERRRTRLQKYVTEKREQISEGELDRFAEGLDRYRISVVVMTPDAMANRPIKNLLRERGFGKGAVVGTYHLYALTKGSPP